MKTKLRTSSIRSILQSSMRGLFALIFLAVPALAGEGTWSGGTTGTWDTSATNWTGVAGTPWNSSNGTTNNATFSTDTVNAAVSGNVTANNIVFTLNGTVSGGNVTLGGTTPGISVASGQLATISSVLAGTANLTKSGAGTLVLSGANTYNGTTAINAGTLALGSSSAFTTKGPLTMANAAGVVFDLRGFNASITNFTSGSATNSITTTGAGSGTDTLTISAFGNDGTGALFTDNGTRKLALSFTSNGVGAYKATTNPLNTYSGGLTLGADMRISPLAAASTNGTSGNITSGPFGRGVITMNGTVAGHGSQIWFGGTNLTLVNDVVVNSNVGNGGRNGSVRVSYPGSVISGNITANALPAIIAADGAIGTNITLSGQLTGTNGFTFNHSSGSNVWTAILNNAAANNDYAGTTTVGSGNTTLQLGAANQIPNGPGKGNVSLTGTLDLNGKNETINGLTGAGTVDNVTVGITNTLTLGDGDATGTTFSGAIKNTTGTLSLVKTGAGIQTFSGNNSYTGGTAVNQGGLVYQKTASQPATGTTTVAAGAMLGLGVLSGNATYFDSAAVDSLFAGNLTNVTNDPFSNVGIDTAAGNFTYSTSLGAYTKSLVKLGANTLVLSGSNSYTGATVITGGVLSADSLNSVAGGSPASNLGAPTTTANGTIAIGSLTSAGTLSYTGGGETTDRVIDLAGTTGGATLDQSGTGLLKFTSNLTATGAGNKTLTLQGSTAGSGEIAGAIVNNSATNLTSIAKAGTGSWTLSGANTYGGATTVSAGNLTVSSTGSINVGSSTTVGTALITGSGSLLIDGGSATFRGNGGGNSALVMGNTTGGGNLTVQNGGSLTLNNGCFILGQGNAGTGNNSISPSVFAQTGGTTAINSTGTNYTGNYAPARLDISGGNFTATNNSFVLGTRCDTSLNVSGNASVAFAALALGSQTGTYTSTANLTGGVLSVSSITRAGGANATINFDGGTLKARAASANFLTANNTFVKSGGARIDDGGFAITIAQPLLDGSGGGGLTKSGSGTLSLSGNNSYTGGTAVNEGSLSYLNVASKPAVGTTTVVAGATLGLGVLSGNATYFDSAAVDQLFADTLVGVSMNATSLVGIDTTAGNFTYSTVQGGTKGLNKLGGNTLLLTGNNSYSGGTILTAGTLQVGVASVGSPGSVTSSAIGTGALTFKGGGLSSDGPTARSIFNALVFSADATLGSATNNGTLTFADAGNFGGAVRTLTVNSAAQFSGALSNGGLTKAGSGTLTLAGNNTFAGNATLSAGTTLIGVDSVGSVGAITSGAFGTGNLVLNAVTVSSDSTTARTILNPVTFNNNVTFGSSTNNGTLTFSAAADLGSAVRTLTLGSAAQFDGVISGTGGITLGNSTATGGYGRLTLTNNSNSFSGGITLAPNSGTIRITSSGALGTGNKTVTNTQASGLVPVTGANLLELDSNGGPDITLGSNISFTTSGAAGVILNTAGNNAINGAFSLTFGNGTSKIISDGGSLTLGGNISVSPSAGGSRTFEVAGNSTGANVVSGAISNGSFTLSVAKTGNGTWTLGAANTYTGATTVTAGTLIISSTGNITSSASTVNGGTLNVNGLAGAVTVNSTGALGGNGAVGAVIVNAGGTLAPGNSPGILSASSVSLNGTTNMELAGNGGVAGTDFDQVVSTGATTYGGALNILSFGGYDITQTASYDLFNFGSQSGDFATVTVGVTGLTLNTGVWTGTDISGNSYSFSQIDGTLAVVAVPEPKTWALIGLGLTFTLFRFSARSRRLARNSGR